MNISHETGGTECLSCLCGNTIREKGFYPCDVEGEIVEATREAWLTAWVVCGECGRLIDTVTLEVVGRRKMESAA